MQGPNGDPSARENSAAVGLNLGCPLGNAIRSLPLNSGNPQATTMPVDDDPFDTLLSLEDGFYKEGYDLGVSDGDHAGLVEGRLFGLEKGFGKYIAIGALYGRATIWAGRLPEKSCDQDLIKYQDRGVDTRAGLENLPVQEWGAESMQAREKAYVSRLQGSNRLETHIRTLYALAEPGSLSTNNDEDSVSDFDDRLRRAEGKLRVLEKLTGESSYEGPNNKPSRDKRGPIAVDMTSRRGDESSIEDISSLRARH